MSGRALAVGADVSAEEAVERAVARIAAELGVPTVLANNAGIIRKKHARRDEHRGLRRRSGR